MTHDVQSADPRSEEVAGLVRALDGYLNERCGPLHNHGASVERLAADDIRVFVARRAGRAVGCAALQVEADGCGEVKRMYVDPAARSLGLGRALLVQVEACARAAGVRLLRLETNQKLAEAQALYRSMGFTACAAFGPYVAEPINLYFEKRLAPQSRSGAPSGK